MAEKLLEGKTEYELGVSSTRPITPVGDKGVLFMAYSTRFLARSLATAEGRLSNPQWENRFVLNAARNPVEGLAETVLATQPKVLGFNLSDPVRNTEGALRSTKAMLTALNSLSAIMQHSLEVPSKQFLKREAKENVWDKFADTPPKKGKTFRGVYITELAGVKKKHGDHLYNEWQERINERTQELHQQRKVLKEKLNELKGGGNNGKT